MKFTSGLSSSGAVKATHRAVTPGARSCRRPRMPVASVDKQSPQPEYVCIEACGALQIVGVQRGFKDAVELGHRFEPPLGFRFCSGFSSEGARPGRCTGDLHVFPAPAAHDHGLGAAGAGRPPVANSARRKWPAKSPPVRQRRHGRQSRPAFDRRPSVRDAHGDRSGGTRARCRSPRFKPATQHPDRTAPFFRAERHRHGRAGALAISLRAPDLQHDPPGARRRGRRPRAQRARCAPSLQRGGPESAAGTRN
jgi:hypothetical protein